MAIYWMFLGLSLLTALWCRYKFQLVDSYGIVEKRAYLIQAILFFAVIIFFCGLRSGIADTYAYIGLFNNSANSITSINWNSVTVDRGYEFLVVLYRQFISTDYHGWLFLCSFVSGVAVMIGFWKYSYDFGMSCFLFIATTYFTYLVNGMRQFICISIVFACTHWIIDRKYIRFIILVLLLSFIHLSVVVMIPVCFFVNAKPWSWRMWLLIIIAGLSGVLFDRILPYLSFLLNDTQYEGTINYIASGGAVGSSIIRLIIALIPPGLALIGRRIVEEEGNKLIDLLVNMSVINLLLYFIATLISGLVMGRVAAYFSIYNLLLLPWLLNHLFNSSSRAFLKVSCVVLYTGYFYYQMVITWHLPYVSDILHISLWN